MKLDEIKQWVAHYQVYGTVPVEVMHELFASAMAVAALQDPSGETTAEIKAGAEAEPAKATRRKKGE